MTNYYQTVPDSKQDLQQQDDDGCSWLLDESAILQQQQQHDCGGDEVVENTIIAWNEMGMIDPHIT